MNTTEIFMTLVNNSQKFAFELLNLNSVFLIDVVQFIGNPAYGSILMVLFAWALLYILLFEIILPNLAKLVMALMKLAVVILLSQYLWKLMEKEYGGAMDQFFKTMNVKF